VTVKASVVIPVLNQREAWLDQCVRSALAQTVPTEVLVVVSPRTGEPLLRMVQQIAGSHPNLRVLQEERPGFAGALNTGIRRSATERVGFLLSDDWLERTAVEECLPFTADIVSTGLSVWAADGRTRFDAVSRRPSQTVFDELPTLERKAEYLEHFFLFQKQALMAVGGVDEDVGLTGCDDFDLIWTLLEHGATVRVLEPPLYNYRAHAEERLTRRSREAQLRDLEKVLDKHGVHGEMRRSLLLRHAEWFGELVHVVFERRAQRSGRPS
jgi:glycosyltransferase involved in cell wall biosynthesis